MKINREVEEVLEDINERMQDESNSECKEFLDELLSEIEALRASFGE